MAGEGEDPFKAHLEEFRLAVKSVTCNGDSNTKAQQLLKAFSWQGPVGLSIPDTEEEQSTQTEEDIIEFYDKYVHITEMEFNVTALHVNFILQYLQESLRNYDVPGLKIGKLVPYGAASEGMSSRLVPYFDVLLPVELLNNGKDVLDVIASSTDSSIPSGFVRLSVKKDVDLTLPFKSGNQKHGLVIIDNEDFGKFLSPTGFRGYVIGSLIEDAIEKYQKAMTSAGTSSLRVFLQRTKKSLEIVVEPNKSWLSSPLRQNSVTISVTPTYHVTSGAFPIYAVAKPRYWKNISATDPHNPLWQLLMPDHERHLLKTRLPKNSEMKQALRIFKTLIILRLKKNSDSMLIYLNSYHYKMALLTYLLQCSKTSDPTDTVEDCLSEFLMVMLTNIKACAIKNIFYANDDVFKYLKGCDSSLLKESAAVNVADTLTAGVVGDLVQELRTTFRNYDWGRDVWALATEKELQQQHGHILEDKQNSANPEMPNQVGSEKEASGGTDGDLEKNLKDDSLFLRIIGISIVVLLIAVVIFSIFGEFELW